MIFLLYLQTTKGNPTSLIAPSHRSRRTAGLCHQPFRTYTEEKEVSTLQDERNGEDFTVIQIANQHLQTVVVSRAIEAYGYLHKEL
jgi:hypothetical protein